MQVAIRADASLDIGTGHVMRCLTLANTLCERGAMVFFICREHPGNVCDLIEQRGFVVRRLPRGPEPSRLHGMSAREALLGDSWQTDAEQSRIAIESQGVRPDLLVADHYALDERWERCLRPLVGRIFVMDDLADRHHDCDVLLDQNLHDSPESRYVGLVRDHTRVFVGPRYALLRPEFDSVVARPRATGLRQLHVFFGGVDPSNEALKVVHAVHSLGPDAPQTDVVLGPVNPRAGEVHATARGMRGIRIIDATSEMATLMARADLAAGTCGGAAWERCVLGLPSLVVVSAENQRDDARILHAMGAVRNLGDATAMTTEGWAGAIRGLQDDRVALLRMSQAAAAVMDGRKEAMQEIERSLVN